MGRRTILLVVAALIAVVGSGMVFLYVRGAEARAMAAQAPVQVLKAVAQIKPGESLSQAQADGKLELQAVPAEQLLEGAMDAIGGNGDLAALTTLYPNEQITTEKFGSAGEQDALTMPQGAIAISVNLTDTGRVAGFVSPGSTVALFYSGPAGPAGQDSSRLLLPDVQVVAVAQTTVTTATTTDSTGGQTTEELPKTLFTLAVNQQDAERVMYASTHGELSFGLRNDTSKVAPGPGITEQNLFGVN